VTKTSGLTLNADKTEKFDMASRNVRQPIHLQRVTYSNSEYTLASQDTIKLNGIIFNSNRVVM